MEFGDRLKQLRTQRHLSQIDLSKKCDISQQSISYIENNQNSPTIYTAQKIADALGVPLTELITDSPYPPAAPVVYTDTVLTETERQLISDFRTLDAEGRRTVLRLVALEKNYDETAGNIPIVENQ